MTNPDIDKSEAQERRDLDKRFSDKHPEASKGSEAAMPKPDESRASTEEDLASKFKGAEEEPSAGPEKKNG
jgi:hypothetical protein